jgi:hypothetical protein
MAASDRQASRRACQCVSAPALAETAVRACFLQDGGLHSTFARKVSDG